MNYIAFFIVTGIAMIFILNNRTRQTLHDMVVGSFVVKTNRQDSPIVPEPIKRSIFYISGAVITVFLIASLTIINLFSFNDKETRIVCKNLVNIDGVLNAAINENTVTYNISGSKSTIKVYIISDYTEAIRINPYDPELYKSRGYAKYNLSDFDGADLDYKTADDLVKKNDNNPNQ